MARGQFAPVNPTLGVAVPVMGTVGLKCTPNAENLLFLEHLQKKATEQDLYEWRIHLSTPQYQARLDEIQSEECAAANTPSSDCSGNS